MTLATPTVDETARVKSPVGEHISAHQIPCGITHPSMPSNVGRCDTLGIKRVRLHDARHVRDVYALARGANRRDR